MIGRGATSYRAVQVATRSYRVSAVVREGDKAAQRLAIGVPDFWTKSEDGQPMPSKKVVDLVDQFMGLTMYEMADFSDLMKKKMRMSDDFHHQQVVTQYDARRMGIIMGMSGQMGGGGGGGAAAPAEEKEKEPEAKVVEKTHFDLKLESFDPAKKVHVIKEVRAITKLGLKEAKDLVEKAPCVILNNVAKEELAKHVQLLESVGAKLSQS